MKKEMRGGMETMGNRNVPGRERQANRISRNENTVIDTLNKMNEWA